ncbi:MAG: DeoR/GlpR family DNA-binding transcription regulator [Rhodobacteraceae bacterium]|nr:DeoR/GlpR family DNA-binding transcription regulator [Paracoccaceae bacterium]
MTNTKEASNQREQEILREIRLASGSCRIGFLAQRLSVSDETIRRNIKSLQARGLVSKVHGGVSLIGPVSVVEPPFQSRMDKNAEAKKKLAARVADMIQNGDSLFMDIGSSTAYVAQALQNHSDLYIVTNSIAVAHLLTARNNNRVFFAGGELRAHDGGAFGSDAISFIRRFNVKYAIMSVGAINVQGGFMLHDIQEADVSCVAARGAQVCIVVADNSKFGHSAPISMRELNDLGILVTDIDPGKDIREMLDRFDISLIVEDGR